MYTWSHRISAWFLSAFLIGASPALPHEADMAPARSCPLILAEISALSGSEIPYSTTEDMLLMAELLEEFLQQNCSADHATKLRHAITRATPSKEAFCRDMKRLHTLLNRYMMHEDMAFAEAYTLYMQRLLVASTCSKAKTAADGSPLMEPEDDTPDATDEVAPDTPPSDELPPDESPLIDDDANEAEDENSDADSAKDEPSAPLEETTKR